MRDELRAWPAFLWAVLAWLGWAILREDRSVRLPVEARRRIEALVERESRPPTPATMSARRWRTVPGVGARHALALVQARDEGRLGAEGRRWEAVPGIGPATAGRIAAWFGEHVAPAGEAARESTPRTAEGRAGGKPSRGRARASPPPAAGASGPTGETVDSPPR